jgi:hypothetical protein
MPTVSDRVGVDGEGDVGGVGVHLDGQSVQSVCERGGPVGLLVLLRSLVLLGDVDVFDQ